MRRRTVAVLAAILAAGVLAFLGSAPFDRPGGASAADAPESIVVGTYNIQSFGTAKLGRPNTLAALAAVASRFDVLAIQEVGSNASTAADATCEKVMETYARRASEAAGGAPYAFVRADQYGILYRTDVIEVVSWASYGGPASFAYPPLAAYFRLRGAPFDFVVVVVHVRPSEARSEIPSLKAVAAEFSERFSEPDVILLGDFNADGAYFDEGRGSTLAPFADGGFISVVPNDADTTVGEDALAYDRIELSDAMSEDWLGTWAVLRPADFADVSACEGPPGREGTEAALSDHYPVLAEFATYRDDD